jgi:hypothetical protein
MKSLSKIFGITLIFLVSFLVCGVALAATAQDLQPTAPAETVTYNEPVQINSSLKATQPSYFPAGVHIGQQGTGGVTYFNGTIVNATTTNNVGNPVTFGDDVRIDGTLFRGATQGPGDNYPLKVNDDVRVYGNLTVEGDIAYDNSASGLEATNVQDAIDEIGTRLTNAISGIGAASGKPLGEALSGSTWEGYEYTLQCTGGDTPPYVTTCTGYTKSSRKTITFIPTSETTGTWESSPGNLFCSSVIPSGTARGSYEIRGEKTLSVFNMSPEPADTVCDVITEEINLVGDKMTIGQFERIELTKVP